MSQENVDAVKRVHERWRRDRGFDPSEFVPDFEIRTPIMELGTRLHRGQEGYAAWRASHDEVFTDDRWEVDEFVDLGDRVLVIGSLVLTGRSSGIETRQPAVQLWSFNEGKFASMTIARTAEEALVAVGRE